MYFFTLFSLGIFCRGGGFKKTLRNTNGGPLQMLTFDDKAGEGSKKPQNLLT